MKQHKKRARTRLRRIRQSEETRRLRERVLLLARCACEQSRIGKCFNRYTQFAIEPDGSISCGFKPIKSINRNECRQFLEAVFEPVDKKGPIELLVDAVDRADRSTPADWEPLELRRDAAAR